MSSCKLSPTEEGKNSRRWTEMQNGRFIRYGKKNLTT